MVKLFIWVAFTIIVGFDVYLAIRGGPTISSVTKAYSCKWATIPYVHGILTGHLFWHIRGTISGQWIRLGILGVITVPIIILDILDYYDIVPIIPMVLSIPLGRLLWPQNVAAAYPIFVWKKK